MEEDSNINVWKVIFPLWPQTLGQLRRESRLTTKATEYQEVELGHLDLSDFYERKMVHLSKIYKALNDPKADRILREVTSLASTRYSQVLRDLTYGNFLAMDDLIVNLLLSLEIVEHQEYSGSHQISDYRFYDSLITGKSNYHHGDSSGILNPFGWFGSVNDGAQLFIMPYCMEYLMGRKEHHLNEIHDFFRVAGFRSQLIDECLEKMKEFHMLHFENSDAINPHRSVISAYQQLMRQPAVLDNFALTTPVPTARLSESWMLTKGYDPTQFFNRCRTTVLFLNTLFDQEAKIEKEIKLGKAGLDSFREFVPAITGSLRYSYNRRLKHLQEEGWPTNARMTEKEWKVLFR